MSEEASENLRPRPERPFKDDDWDNLTQSEKHARNVAHREEDALWRLERDGRRRLDGWQENAEQWCTNCQTAFERLDSHGDCADCGEDVWWVERL